jgi:hypothetical protein
MHTNVWIFRDIHQKAEQILSHFRRHYCSVWTFRSNSPTIKYLICTVRYARHYPYPICRFFLYAHRTSSNPDYIAICIRCYRLDYISIFCRLFTCRLIKYVCLAQSDIYFECNTMSVMTLCRGRVSNNYS